MDVPNLILLFAGKRKSGKDFTVEHCAIGIGKNNCEIIRISEPIKMYWAEIKGLDLTNLLSDSEYKEMYRREMIEWSEKKRNEDYGIFCKKACLKAPVKPVWIVSDIRRRTDLRWFRETYNDIIRTVKITASDETRKQRGWVFQEGIDDAESECDLDSLNEWDYVIRNDSRKEEFNDDFAQVLEFTKSLITR